MSIFDETGGGLGAVAHDRSLELFFDRFEVIARFVALLRCPHCDHALVKIVENGTRMWMDFAGMRTLQITR